MTRFMIHTGIAEPEGDGYKLKPHMGLSAIALAGAESFDEYESYVKLKIVDSNSASLLFGWQWDEDYKVSYVEFMLDVVNQKLILYLFIETESAAPVEALARAWSLERNREYVCSIKLHKDEEGTIWAFCYLDDVEVFRFEPLGAIFEKGMWGLKVDGADGTYSVFTEIFHAPYGAKVFVDRIFNRIKLSSSDISYPTAWKMVLDAIANAESETETTLSFTSLEGDYLILVRALAGIYYLCYLTGGIVSGTRFTLGSLSISTETGVDVGSVFAQLKGEVEALLEKLNQPELRAV